MTIFFNENFQSCIKTFELFSYLLQIFNNLYNPIYLNEKCVRVIIYKINTSKKQIYFSN